MLGGGLQDEMLRAYIDKIFDQYDKDKSGSLDQQEMASFFNALFGQLGIQQNVTREQSLQAIKMIDSNNDGRIDKNELFLAFKAMLTKAQMAQQPPPPPQYNYPYGGYPPPPYSGYPNYPQYPQGYGYGGYPPPQQPQGYPQSPFYPQYPPNPNQMYGSQGPYGNQGQFGNPGMSASYQSGYGYGSNYSNQYKK